MVYMHAGEDDSAKGQACGILPLVPANDYWAAPLSGAGFGICPAFRACGEGEGGFTAVVGLAQCAASLTTAVHACCLVLDLHVPDPCMHLSELIQYGMHHS